MSDWILNPSVQGTQPIVRLARRCPPHRRRLRRYLGQLRDLFQRVNAGPMGERLGAGLRSVDL